MSNDHPTENHVSGKSLRRRMIAGSHERLRVHYRLFCERQGQVLTYAQWLHPQMRERFEKPGRPVRPHRSGGGQYVGG